MNHDPEGWGGSQGRGTGRGASVGHLKGALGRAIDEGALTGNGRWRGAPGSGTDKGHWQESLAVSSRDFVRCRFGVDGPYRRMGEAF